MREVKKANKEVRERIIREMKKECAVSGIKMVTRIFEEVRFRRWVLGFVMIRDEEADKKKANQLTTQNIRFFDKFHCLIFQQFSNINSVDKRAEAFRQFMLKATHFYALLESIKQD